MAKNQEFDDTFTGMGRERLESVIQDRCIKPADDLLAHDKQKPVLKDSEHFSLTISVNSITRAMDWLRQSLTDSDFAAVARLIEASCEINALTRSPEYLLPKNTITRVGAETGKTGGTASSKTNINKANVAWRNEGKALARKCFEENKNATNEDIALYVSDHLKSQNKPSFDTIYDQVRKEWRGEIIPRRVTSKSSKPKLATKPKPKSPPRRRG